MLLLFVKVVMSVVFVHMRMLQEVQVIIEPSFPERLSWISVLERLITGGAALTTEHVERFKKVFRAEGLQTFMLTWLTLSATATPTEESKDDEELPPGVIIEIPDLGRLASGAGATEKNILGPYFRPGAPFRGKVTPPFELGEVIVVRGRVWGFDTRKPLVGALLDVWQANSEGRYDNDDPAKPPKAGVFLNRVRLRTDESGYYEYESIVPGPYQIGTNLWRPAHIHYHVQHPGYKSLTTQLYFKGDPHNRTDSWIRPTLIVDFATIKARHGSFRLGTFDVVLAAGKGAV